MKDVIEQAIDSLLEEPVVEAKGLDSVPAIMKASKNAQNSVKDKPVRHWVDIPLDRIDLSSNPITSADAVDPEAFFENFEASADNPITAMELVQATYEGVLSICPYKGDNEETDSYVNFNDEDYHDSENAKTHNAHESRIAKLWLKLKKMSSK